MYERDSGSIEKTT